MWSYSDRHQLTMKHEDEMLQNSVIVELQPHWAGYAERKKMNSSVCMTRWEARVLKC